MKNIFEVLRQKEADLQQLQKDIEALRVAARLLADDEDPANNFAETRRPASSDALMPPLVRASAPVSAAVAAPPVACPSASISPGEGYSAARDNSLRQFP